MNQKQNNEEPYQNFLDLIMSHDFTLHQITLYQPSSQDNSSQSYKQMNNIIVTTLLDIMQQSFQTVVNDFLQSLKRDRVPIQKTIIKNFQIHLDRSMKTLDTVIEIKSVVQKINNLLLEDITLLIFTLGQISKPILEFFQNQFIDEVEKSEINAIEVNLYHFQTAIMKGIIAHCLEAMSITENSAYFTILQQQETLFEELTYELCDQISKIFDEGRNYVEILKNQFREKVPIFHKKTFQQFIMNKYMILQLLLELSRNCYQVVQDLLEFTIFHYAEPDISERFMKYIIENHDILKIKIQKIQIKQQEPFSKINFKYQEKGLVPKNLIVHSKKFMVDECLRMLNQLITSKQKSLSVYRVSYRVNQKDQKTLKTEIDESKSPSRILAQYMNEDNSFKFSLISSQSKAIKQINEILVEDTKSFQKGLYVECEDPQFRFMVFMESFSDTFKIVYAPLVSKRWTFEKTYVVERGDGERYFSNDQKAGWVIQPIKYNSIKDLVDSPWLKDQLLQIIKWSEFEFQERMELSQHRQFEGEIDTMIGFFLANVTKTNQIVQYLQKFGETAVNNGCMSSIIQDIAIIGEFLSVGGFGQQALKTHTTVKTPSRKMVPITRLVISTGTSLGSAVSGAIIGQFLIPIPLFGSIVGGLLGGYIGNRSVNKFLTKHNKKKAFELTRRLRELQVNPEGYWTYSKSYLDVLQITNKYFNSSMPKSLKSEINKDTIWINIIIFSYLSLYFTTLKDSNQQNLNEEDEWPDCLEYSQKWMILEKINVLPCLDEIKQMIEVILKNI